ncbi:hypothetical protein EYR40_001049 [Pleurotus pulmonarius]|nr:hypothetical protein EYR36_004784 [Pleurotus pulmonarius]KAF4578794.1 hypothetical protein EYR36_000601 [Pleurotus pulmonarius]KAF4603876.1 hypothetical protein EYR38_004292 [Pleurotus pulmonarius]KAF4608702.1 hypothetical protein EYR40_001049 [Pleurotus pulmonarius]
MITLFRTICKRWDATKRWTKGPSARGNVPQVLPPFEESLAVQTEDSSLAKGKKKKRTRGRGRGRRQKATTPSAPMVPETYKSTQPFDAFLVLDVEATCQQGSSFDYPNEIIELPVTLVRWTDKIDGKASQLEVVDEFHSFVKPTWRPTLSEFCTQLTGITQDTVDAAPDFPVVLASLRQFLVKHELIDSETEEPLMRFCWCTDGPHDIRDFFVKQCFISKVEMPQWIRADVMDVRSTVVHWLASQAGKKPITPATKKFQAHFGVKRPLNITLQLEALGLPPFEGRQHCGMHDARNVARIVTELARKGIRLQPNTPVHPHRRWVWMGHSGQILDLYR